METYSPFKSLYRHAKGRPESRRPLLTENRLHGFKRIYEEHEDHLILKGFFTASFATALAIDMTTGLMIGCCTAIVAAFSRNLWQFWMKAYDESILSRSISPKAALVIVLCLFSTSAYAAMYFLSSNQPEKTHCELHPWDAECFE